MKAAALILSLLTCGCATVAPKTLAYDIRQDIKPGECAMMVGIPDDDGTLREHFKCVVESR